MPGALDRIACALARRAKSADGRLDRRFLLGALALAYAIFCATYLPINEFSVGRAAHVLFLPGEERIPFVPEFEYLYILGYLFPLLVVTKLPDVERLLRLVAAFALVLAVAYATYLLFPVYLERPRLQVDSLSTHLLSLEYLDHSYNHFPSLHVAIAWLVYLACRDGLLRPRILLLAVLGMSAAAVFVKQHYLADIVYGTVLAGAAWSAAGPWAARYRPAVAATRRSLSVGRHS